MTNNSHFLLKLILHFLSHISGNKWYIIKLRTVGTRRFWTLYRCCCIVVDIAHMLSFTERYLIEFVWGERRELIIQMRYLEEMIPSLHDMQTRLVMMAMLVIHIERTRSGNGWHCYAWLGDIINYRTLKTIFVLTRRNKWPFKL